MIHLSHLPSARDNEQVVLFLRRHWFAPFTIVFWFVALSAIPLLITWYFADRVESWLTDPFFGPLVVVIASMYFLSVWLFAFMEFTDYYLDTWIITNERILNNEQEGLFKRTESELDLVSIQDTTAETHGFLQTIFTFGNVVIQTAGEKERFVFKNVDNPEKIKAIIMKQVEDKRARMSQQKTAS